MGESAGDTVRRGDGVVFRNQTEAPTGPGWYYGNGPKGSLLELLNGTEIEPRKVYATVDGGLAVIEGVQPFGLPINDYAWFGPVPTVREG